MDDKKLARLVAADLGMDVVAAVDNPVSPGEATRGLGLTEAILVGSFLAACAQLAVKIWEARQDRALLVLALGKDSTVGPNWPRAWIRSGSSD